MKLQGISAHLEVTSSKRAIEISVSEDYTDGDVVMARRKDLTNTAIPLEEVRKELGLKSKHSKRVVKNRSNKVRMLHYMHYRRYQRTKA